MLTRRTTPLAALAAALALPLSLVVAAPAAAATVNVNTWAGLQAAMLVDGDTVVLTGNVTNLVGENLAVESAESVTLDLNGFTLSISGLNADYAAVHVPAAATLTINDSAGGGILNATGGVNGAGIGGGSGGHGGTVTVNGGTITATSGNFGAGIGGGIQGSGGTVTVNGGTITATSGNFGAGIGGGIQGAGGTVTVNGGTIAATGGDQGAGIGGGFSRAGGTVTVNGGTISATSGLDGAGIGGGYSGAGGTVTVNGGTITATGGQRGAGIGSGAFGSGGTLAIHGTPDAGNAIDGGSGNGANAGVGAPITNPTMPTGIGYSAVTSLVGTGGREGGKIVVVFNYLVTFDATGGSNTDTQKVNEGGTAAEPADPTRTGYEFAGWRVGDTAYDFSTPVTEPITLTATWTEVLAPTGADRGLFLPIAVTLLLLGGTLLTVGRTRRA